MAGPSANAGSLGGVGRLTEVRQRLTFVVIALVIYRLGAHITIPGIDQGALADMFEQQSGTILDMFNMFSGGALGRLSIFALGVMPYISASIIMQLMTAVVPKLKQLRSEGEQGRRAITKYTRYGTLGLALFQGIGITVALQNQGVVLNPGPMFVFIGTTTLVTGTMFLMWLGEQITERGIGNGISLIIFAGIVAGLPSALGGTLELTRTGELGIPTVLLLLVLAVSVIWFIVFMERGQRRITINYARRQQGRKMYAGQTSHLPLKINMAGVIPAIFASSIILFPATIGQWFGEMEGFAWMQRLGQTLSPGQPLYITFYAAAIIFFCFFYTALVFNSRDTADNLKRSGAFIPGVRPGEQTSRYIDKVMTRLTLVGAGYITAVCLLPEFLILYLNVPFYFGGTALLIIVVVVMDFMSQLQAHLVSHQYEPLMKKANLQAHGRGGGSGLAR
ncbi:preprotein translocase subunit SecY [Spiribacter vilamensis]|uniref:Protein translocase subunit SecY n=1 Tax=Spiribacter vilamensis TaxID=531306 RepID=A0A4Q8CXY7_9GAMM|nr:preprotein translocase subunit SecY [Spiribacter vilamensis]RZU97794.1 protein translocase subunit secY/sec61 alpha [Spiribacter vilamensis]TVO61280.1 preprotein translocase subunit SecY [Spiribacter vilamensis]